MSEDIKFSVQKKKHFPLDSPPSATAGHGAPPTKPYVSREIFERLTAVQTLEAIVMVMEEELVSSKMPISIEMAAFSM